MPIISFWSSNPRESGQTLSIAALATYMAIEHNYKILLVDATFDDDTLERCFWKVNNGKDVTKMLNKGKMDISSGAEGLVSAVASNKTTPEIITNYTRVVFKNRLDVLCGLKTKIPEEFTKSLMLYKDLVKTADKYYDLVFVDLEKTLKKDTTKTLLETSHVIVTNFSQNLKQIDEFIETKIKNPQIIARDKCITLLSNADENSKYNVKNVTRYVKEKDVQQILYNPIYKEAASEAGVATFFLKTRLSNSANDKNSAFIKAVESLAKAVDYKLEELKYKA